MYASGIMPYQIDSPHNKIKLAWLCQKAASNKVPVSYGDERKP